MTEAAATFRATIKPHPLRAGVVDDRVPVGCTLADMGAGGAVLAFVEGERADDLGYVPQVDQHVVLIATAEGGGGGKDPLRLAATLALAFAAPGIGAGIAGAGASAGAAAGWGLAVNLAGNLAINALVPPSTQSLDRFDPLKPFEGLPNASNALQPFGVIPRLYGTHRVFPPQASRPFSESEGSDQYLRMLLCLGHGPLEIDGLAPGLHRAPDVGGTSTVPGTVRIGETALNEFADWELEWLPGGDSDPPLTLFTRNVIEVAPEAPVFDDDGVTATRTAAAGRMISVDVAAPAVVFFRNGRPNPAAASFTIEVRASGSAGPWLVVAPPDAEVPGDVPGFVAGDWREAYSGNYPLVDGNNDPAGENVLNIVNTIESHPPVGRRWFIKGSEVKPVSLSVQIELPTSAAYDVRLTRRESIDGNFFGINLVDAANVEADFAWRALRTIGADIAQTVPAGLAFLALRIRTTDQLNGVVNNLSVVAHAPLPVWNGSAWVMQRTSNPAWIYRDVLTGAATGRPLDVARVDDDALIDWAARNTADDREFNGIFDGRTTVYEAARNVASTGRAAFSIRDGLFSVVEDMPDKVPRQLFTPRNCWDFGATKTFSRPLHALKVKFKDRDADWQDSERIVYADGYSEDGSGGTEVATEFESLALFGLTDEQQAFIEGRYFQAVAVLRPETATWMADIENLVCRRGDVVRYQHDAMLLGLGAGRIKATTVGSVTLDESLTVEVGKTYQLRIRRDDGTQSLSTITNAPGTHKTLTLNGGLPAGVKVGDLAAFGETGLVTQDWLITGMEPQADMQARITAVPYSSLQVFDAGPIPPYDPLVTRAETRPPEPVIVNVLAGTDAALRGSNGSRTPRILVSYVFPSSPVGVPYVEAALLRASERTWEMRPWQPNSGLYTFVIADANADYRVRIRGVAADGTAGPWAEAVALAKATGGEALSISLVEQINTPSTPEGDLSTVVATVEPPDPEEPDAEDYSHSAIDYRRVGDVAWQSGGLTDPNGQARVVLVADGATYEFRARAVSIAGIVDDDGPTELITLTDAAVPVPDPDAGATPDAALNVANLRIAGFAPTVSEFNGADAPLEWDAVTGAQDYRVRIFSAGGSPVQLRLQYVRAPRFTYTYAQNALDAEAAGLAGPQREFLVEVMARSRDGRISATPAEKQAINPAPVLPGDFIATAFFSAIEMQYSTPDDGDYAGVRVHMSTTEGFTPGPDNVVYDGGTEMPIIVQGLEAGTTYYYRLVLRDLFGPGPASDEFESTTQGLPWEDNVPPTVPTGLTLRSEVQEADLYTSAALIAEWEAATDNSGRLFYEIEYWTDEAEVAADTRSGNEEEAFVLAMFDGSDTVAVGLEEGAVAGGIFRDATVATSYTVFPARVGATYYFRVRAVDYSGNASDWSGLRQHTIVGDTTPPAVPTGLTLTGGLDKAVLRWTNPPDTDWLQTRVHRGTSGLFTAGPQNLIAETRGSVYVDTPLVPGINYWYRLVAVDSSGNASAATAATGPVQAIRIDPVNVEDFLAPNTIDPDRFTQAFRDQVAGIESNIGGIDAQLGVIDTTLTDLQADVTGLDGLVAGLDDSVDDLAAAQAAQAGQINSIQAELADLLNTPDFDTGNDYLINDAVVFDGKLYRAIADQTAPSVAPPDVAFWELIGDFASIGEAVAANTAAISLLETEVTDQDGRITSNATAITGLISDVTAVETGQAAQATAITALETTTTQQGNDISSNANAITAVAAELDAAEQDITALSDAFTSLDATVSTQGTQITANSSAITSLQADLQTAESGIAANATAISGLQTTTTTQAGLIAANASDITALEADVSSLETGQAGQASAISALQAEVTSQGDDITANASDITGLQADLSDAEGNIAVSAAAISALETTTTQQGTDISANASNIAALQVGLTAAEGDITANAGAINTLEAEVTEQDGRITANTADITGLTAVVEDPVTGVAANADAISTLETTVTQQGEDIEATAGDVTAIFADLTVPEFGLSADAGSVLALSDESGAAVAAGARLATAGAIESLQVTVSQQGDELVSTSSQVTALESEVVALGGTVSGNSTSISSLTTTVTQQGADITSNATAITALQSGLQDIDGDVAANASAITGLQTTVTQQGTDITSNSAAITAVEASITTLQGDVSGNASAISGLDATVTSQGGSISANASAITALSTEVDDNTASITSAMASIDGIEAQFSIRANVNGRITGFGLIAGGATTTFGILADRFIVVDPSDNSTAQAPFEIVGGSVYIKSAFIRNLDAGDITTGTLAAARIASGSITADKLTVSTLSALSANLGTVTAGLLIGATFVTTETGARVQIDKFNGIRTVNSSNQTTAQLSLNGAGFLGVGGSAISWNAAGTVTVPGTLIAGDIIGNTFRTATSGWRVEVGPSLTGSTVLRYTNGTTTRLSLDQFGNLNVTGAVTGSTITGGVLRTSAFGTRVQIDSSDNSLKFFQGASQVIHLGTQAATLPPDLGGGSLDISLLIAPPTGVAPLYCAAVGAFTSAGTFYNGSTNGIGLNVRSGGRSMFAETTGTNAIYARSRGSSAIVMELAVLSSGGNTVGLLADAGLGTGAKVGGESADLWLTSTHQSNIGGHIRFQVGASFGRPTWTAPEGTLVGRRESSGSGFRLWIQTTPGSGSSWLGLATF
tara:strand:+ start:24996 stop:32939 length:7944 start_codon:yes stop_codon:yes gene_type:complete